MKIKDPEYSQMKEFIRKTLIALDIHPFLICNNSRKYQIWHKAHCCATYPDDNPNALCKGKRAIDKVDFPLYPCGSNDESLLTALNKIIKELNEF